MGVGRPRGGLGGVAYNPLSGGYFSFGPPFRMMARSAFSKLVGTKSIIDAKVVSLPDRFGNSVKVTKGPLVLKSGVVSR